jgi:hypothetical protein
MSCLPLNPKGDLLGIFTGEFGRVFQGGEFHVLRHHFRYQGVNPGLGNRLRDEIPENPTEGEEGNRSGQCQ